MPASFRSMANWKVVCVHWWTELGRRWRTSICATMRMPALRDGLTFVLVEADL